jgi:hypothetical protein
MIAEWEGEKVQTLSFVTFLFPNLPQQGAANRMTSLFFPTPQLVSWIVL